jgi:hypothetical protein
MKTFGLFVIDIILSIILGLFGAFVVLKGYYWFIYTITDGMPDIRLIQIYGILAIISLIQYKSTDDIAPDDVDFFDYYLGKFIKKVIGNSIHISMSLFVMYIISRFI